MTGQLVAYARVSTVEQVAGFEAQIRDLKAAGCEKIFNERVSSIGKREQLENALDYVRDGDTFVVTKLDRLARSLPDLVKIIERLEQKKVALRILAMNLDTATPTGRLMVNLLGAVAQFEREIMISRQLEGIAKAKAEGKYVGRQPTARPKHAEARALVKDGMSKSKAAKTLGIGRGSVYRALEAAE